MIVAAILAAGAGRRFDPQQPKQLARLAGRPLIEHAVAAALAADSLDAIAVVLGARARQIAAGCDLGRAEILNCEDWACGQSRSLRTAVNWAQLRAADALVITLADQPLIAPAAIDAVADARAAGIDCVRASYDGRGGHPLLLEANTFPAAAALDGDQGARVLLGQLRSRTVACPGSAVDIDSQSALALLARELR